MVPSNGANAQRRVESACTGADSFSTAKCKLKIATLIPAILMMQQHHYGPKQWCKCTAAHRIGLQRRGQLLDRQVQTQNCDVDSCDSDGAAASVWSQAMVQMHSGAPCARFPELCAGNRKIKKVLFIDESGTHRGAQKRVQAMQLTLCFSGALEISPKRCTAQRRKRRLRVAHAAKRLTLRKLRSTMQVGRLDVMSNVVSASSLLVHRNEDAENSSLSRAERRRHLESRRTAQSVA
jgi:hypothetical protein